MKTWKNIARPVEVEEKGAKNFYYASSIGDVASQPMVTNEEELQSRKETEIRTMQNLLIHKIGSLKHSS